MKNLRRHFIAFLAVVFLMTCLPASALAASVGDKMITTQGAIVIDFETGAELYGYNADVKRVPASLTKLLAAYVVFDAIKAGEIGLDTIVTIPKSISDFSYNREYSNVPMPVGSQISVSLLMEFVIVSSGCAATDALAVALCGDVTTFVARMNSKTASLGIDAVFFDTYGGSGSNQISPRGMAIITRGLISDHPEIFNYAALPYTSYRGLAYNNTNKLLTSYDGADGLKTGYIQAAGYCFVGTAARDGRRIISVSFGSGTTQSRFSDSEKLLDYGFQVADSIIAEFMTDKIYPASSIITVNGNYVALTVYNIADYHYFKLRDIAFLLGDTEKSFQAEYDNDTNAVLLTSDTAYTPIGDELDIAPADTYRTFKATTSQIFLDGVECSFEVYNIDDYNYFKLRDLAALIDFGVSWDEETFTVIIDTSTGYVADNLEDGAEGEAGEVIPEDGAEGEAGEVIPEDGAEGEAGEVIPEDGAEGEAGEVIPEDGAEGEAGEIIPEDGENNEDGNQSSGESAA